MTDGRPPRLDPSSKKLDTDLIVSDLLRRVADELEDQNDPLALSQAGRARLVRLTRDLEGARALRFYEPRTERCKGLADGSYLLEESDIIGGDDAAET